MIRDDHDSVIRFFQLTDEFHVWMGVSLNLSRHF